MPKPTLILAEDHPQFADYFFKLLQQDFDVVAVVDDGGVLVEVVGELHPDAIVVDLGLKGINGIDATREIRLSYPNVPIVLMTASNDPDLRVEGLAAGASAFFSKLQAGSYLVEVVKDLLGGDPA